MENSEEQIKSAILQGALYSIILSENLNRSDAVEVKQILSSLGATHLPLLDGDKVDLKGVNYIISETVEFAQYAEAEKLMIAVVTPEWVHYTAEKSRIGSPRAFSPDPRMFFKGVVATTAELPPGDREALFGGIAAYGGMYTTSLSKTVSHLIVLSTDNDKCRHLKAKKATHVKVILPHWFDDCLKLGQLLPEGPYMFPNPEILRGLDPKQPVPLLKAPAMAFKHPLRNGVATNALNSKTTTKFIEAQPFNNRSFFISSDIRIREGLREVLNQLIRDGGGICASEFNAANVVLCHYREGETYVKAHRAEKVVGNLTWLYYMIAHGKWTNPLACLLHYPVCRDGLPGVRNEIISVSNYQGDARQYLEALIVASGGKFTKNMKLDNTMLITARDYGDKCDAARDWNIHIVNHLWLEESYAKWVVQSLTNQRFTHFPKRSNLTDVIGSARLDEKTLERFWSGVTLDGDDDHSKKTIGIKSGPREGYKSGWINRKVDPLDQEAKNTTPKAIKYPLAQKSTPKSDILAALIDPPSTGRAAKSKAQKIIHQNAEDMNIYQKERSRKGGFMAKGRWVSEMSTADESTQFGRKRSVSSVEPESEAAGGQSHKKSRRRSLPKSHVLVTGYQRWVNPQLESEDKKILKDLGIVIIDQPQDCKILAASTIVRTAKFLCALALAPCVVSTGWLEACRDSRELLPPELFPLKDENGEEKYKFKLEESLRCSRLNNGKLLEGVVVYGTPEITTGPGVCQKIVESNGGIFINFKPRQRGNILPDSSRTKVLPLISSTASGDVKLWTTFKDMAVKEGLIPAIVKVEWLLDVAMWQKLDWGDAYKYDAEA